MHVRLAIILIEGQLDKFGRSSPVASTAAGEESSAIRAIAECAVGGALRFIYQATPLFELHVNAAASRVHSNTLLGGGNADYHTGLI
jgi:hypothetical protein